MKLAILFAGAVTLGIAGPAAANPGNGRGHGNGHGNGYGYDNAYGVNGPVGYGHGGCPPGLAKKNNGCMPPGQAKKLARGQHWQSLYGSHYGYGQIPYDLRQQYDLTPRYNYYYGNGYLYQVDPRTQLVSQVISALLH